MLNIDKYSRTPIYEQIITETERQIAAGILKADSVLPSVRALSQSLAINPNTIQKAYAELERRGLCYSVPGNGRFITKEAREIVYGQKKQLLTNMKQLTQELKEAGIALDLILTTIQEAYAESGKEVR